MYCVQNRNYCNDCIRSYIDNNYPNLLRSHGHFNSVMKKRCCSSNFAITWNTLYCNDHGLECCMSKLSPKFDVNTQTSFVDKQGSS